MSAMASNVTLRPASMDDADPIARIWYGGWRDGHLGHVPDVVASHRGRATFHRRAPGQIAHTTVAVAGGSVVGFVTVRDDEIEQLYVAPAARGDETAVCLLRHGERLISGDGHLRCWLAVAPGNKRARRFYERERWHDTGGIEYKAGTADGGTVAVPCQRYEKCVQSIGHRTC